MGEKRRVNIFFLTHHKVQPDSAHVTGALADSVDTAGGRV